MKKIILILLGLIAFLNANSQKLPSKNEQYDFLKWYVAYKNLVPLDTSFKFHPTFSSINLEDVPLVSKMSRAEKKYLFMQVKLTKTNADLDLTNMWHPGKSPDNYINYCSLPIFTLNKKIAIVMWGIYCGNDCGEESFDVFVKTKNNTWKLLKTTVPVIVF